MNAPHARQTFLPPKLSEPQTSDLIRRNRPFCLVAIRTPLSPSSGQLIVGFLGDDVDWWFAHRGFGGGEMREARSPGVSGVGTIYRSPSVAFDGLTVAGRFAAAVVNDAHKRCPWKSASLPCRKPLDNHPAVTNFLVGSFGEYLCSGFGQSSSPARECFDPGGTRKERQAGLEPPVSEPCGLLVLIAENRGVPIVPVSQVNGKRDIWKKTLLGTLSQRPGEISGLGFWLHDGPQLAGAWFGPSSQNWSVLLVEKATVTRAFWYYYSLPSQLTQGPHISNFGICFFLFPGFGGSGFKFFQLKSNKSSPVGIWIFKDLWYYIGPIRMWFWALNMPRFSMDWSFDWDPGGPNFSGKS